MKLGSDVSGGGGGSGGRSKRRFDSVLAGYAARWLGGSVQGSI